MPSPPLFHLDLSRYGGSLVVTQGFNDPDDSHNGIFAHSLDFRLPAGAPVYAFASGTVRDLRESVPDGRSASTGGADPSVGTSGVGNVVSTQVSVGWISYAHFQQNSVRPSEGDFVSGGDRLGTVGTTGARTGPHLHVTFSVDDRILASSGLQFADGSPSQPRPIFDTATGDILPGVVSQVSYDMQGASNLDSDMHNLTLLGTANINGQGDRHDNVISGNRGRNLLYGRGGEDSIYGGDGNDTLLGGAGGDRLVGGSGADVFRFDVIADSVPGSGRDTISDFNRSQGDHLDVSGIDWNSIKPGAQNPTFIGSQSFHRVAGEMRLENGRLQADVNGDGRADWEVRIPGMTSLRASDWILD